MYSKRSGRIKVNFEIPIIILIAGLIIVLMNFTNRKLAELSASDAEVLFIAEDAAQDPEFSQILGEAIQEYKTEACKMVEMYDDELNLLVKIEFGANISPGNMLVNYPQLVDILINNESGNTSIEIGDSIEYVYFRWADTESGERVLFMIYTSKETVHNFWIINALCYAILILVGLLMVSMIIRRSNDRIEYYNEISGRSQC